MKMSRREQRVMKIEGCALCPRSCGVNRSITTGACGETNRIRIARAALHFWEEPCISGERGSGAVFFSGCQLRCVYCQNRSIANGDVGREISAERLCEIFFELEAKGANNINLVTPDHFIPQIIKSIELAKRAGISLPFVYNTSSYVNLQALRRLDGLIDIYLPDFKYLDEKLAGDYSGAADYPAVAKAALSEMYRQVGSVRFHQVAQEPEPMLSRGMVVRHLLLPGALEDAKRIVSYLYETYGDTVYVSLLSQYTPGAAVAAHPILHRRIRKKDYDALVDFAIDLGVTNAFIQEGSAASESFIPEFNYEGV
jgi:putative pyruvate formate lyase activating enzyme